MTDAAATVPVKLAPLREWMSGLLVRQGMYAADAEIAARRLLEGELLGRPAAGLCWLPRLREGIELGDIDPRAQLVTVVDLPALAVVDGGTGIGQVAVTKALELAAAKARAVGSAAIVVRNSRPLGDPTACLGPATSAGCLVGIVTTCKPEAQPWPIGPCAVWGWPGSDRPLIASNELPPLVADRFAEVAPTALCGSKLASAKKRLLADDAEHLCVVIDISHVTDRARFDRVAGEVPDEKLLKAPPWLFDPRRWPETVEIPATTAAELRDLATAARIPAEW